MTPSSQILILTEDSKPQKGGIAEFLHNFSLALSKYFPVKIITSCASASAYSQMPSLAYEEVKWFRSQFAMRGDNKPFVHKINTLKWLMKKKSYAKEQLVLALNGETKKKVIIFRLSDVTHPWCQGCRELGIPYTVVAHGKEFLESHHFIKRFHLIQDLRMADRVFANSNATRELVQTLGVSPSRVTRVVIGVEPNRFLEMNTDKKRKIKSQLNFCDKPFIFSLCCLIPRKGIDLAIRVFSEIATSYPHLGYVIGGMGPEYDRLKGLADELGVASRVHFVGAIDDDAKHVLFSECQFFVLPNRRLKTDMEGFGIVFLEAALYGKTSIGGNNGGVPDAIQHDLTGLLVDTERGHEDLAKAMRQLLIHPDFAKQLGEQAKKRVLSDFNSKKMIAPFLEYFLDANQESLKSS